MLFNNIVSAIAVLVGAVAGQYTTVKYYDKTTGITFSSFSIPNGITYRVALPTDSTTSDAIYQIVGPIEYKWAGMAWGGHMTNNPLTVAWPNPSATNPVVSSRWAQNGHYSLPGAYTGATYTYLKGTGKNSTHWTLTVRCQGCTRWTGSDGGQNAIDNSDSTLFAYACSTTAPSNPSSNTSTFSIHEEYGSWNHNLALGKNASYSTWIMQNNLTETKVPKLFMS